MRKSLAACCAAILFTLLVAPLARAAEFDVRIEGKEETLYEGRLPVAIHPIEAASDTKARECAAVNEAGEEPAVTPTLAAAEAMESIGQTFDARWSGSNGPHGDYFVTRWGPDEEDAAEGAWWGILVNDALTKVGGCQYRLHEDDEVLWLWNAFGSRPLLALFPEAAHYTAGPRPTRVVAEAGEPIPLEVVSYPAGGEGVAPESPSRTGSSPYRGAEIAPVTVNAEGFQRVELAGPGAVTTDAEGKASVTYDEPGVYRIKAAVGPLGIDEGAVRSNGLEICVEAKAGECGESAPGGEAGGGSGTTTTQPPTTTATASSATAPTAAPKIGKARLVRSGLASGRLKIGWQVLDPGAGVKGWKVETRTVGGKGGWTVRAHGGDATGATIRLGRGKAFQVRLVVTDLAGHSKAYGLGKVSIPGRDRS
jgi:hypothetical protein